MPTLLMVWLAWFMSYCILAVPVVIGITTIPGETTIQTSYLAMDFYYVNGFTYQAVHDTPSLILS